MGEEEDEEEDKKLRRKSEMLITPHFKHMRMTIVRSRQKKTPMSTTNGTSSREDDVEEE